MEGDATNRQPEGAPDKGRRWLSTLLISFPILSTLIGVLTPIIGYVLPPETANASGQGRVKVGTTADIPVGHGKVVPLGNKPVIVVNTDQGVKAYSAVCTHLGCIVTWDEGQKVILCPCHDGYFSPATGSVLSGPPPNPLPTVPVTVKDGEIYVGEA